jgi:hypothetical protein
MTGFDRNLVLVLCGAGLAAFVAGACGSPSDEAPRGRDDSGTGGSEAGSGTGCGSMSTYDAVETLFASTCAGSTCHSSGPGGQFPPLADTPAKSWMGHASTKKPGIRLVVPGQPAQSFLYMKLSGTQGAGGGALMPLGAASPTSAATTVRAWIEAGAPTSCDEAGADPPSTDPNTLDQASLFTCPANAPPRSSPARVRRIDSPEWTTAIPEPLNGVNSGVAYLNPFDPLATAPYATYAIGTTVDTPTLQLYFQVLPDAPRSWDGLGTRLLDINPTGDLNCMFGYGDQASPSDACIDTYVDRLLTMGVLARTPTATEHANLRAFLVTALAAEGGDVTKRPATIALVDQAAWLTSGALFHSEMGAPVSGDPAHRSRLTHDELALAVGSMLSYHRPGAPMYGSATGAMPPSPDNLCNTWLYRVRVAADDGTLEDSKVIQSLIAAYGGGVDPGGRPLDCMSGTTLRRRDQSFEYSVPQLDARGEYWLAPRIADFFKEWLGYGTANAIFKDTPGLTSRFLTSSNPYDSTTAGFNNLQNAYYGRESTLVQQLDDTIARTVIDAATSHQDVFQALLTTRLWHLPSDRADTNGVACSTTKPCTATGYGCTVEGVCGDSISASTATAGRVYDVEGVPATDTGRWVEMPASERLGVLTHPAWLGAAGEDNFQDDPNLIHRGKAIREKLFCETVPPLALVMVAAQLGPRSLTLSARDRVHAAIDPDPTCLGCHQLMNPLGLPFEMYDGAGFLRLFDKYDADAQGNPTTLHPPDATTTIGNLPDPALNGEYKNALEFIARLATSSYARRCFIRQAFRYFMGRDEAMADQCTLAAMESTLDKGSFFDMLGTLASSDSVLYRSNGGM